MTAINTTKGYDLEDLMGTSTKSGRKISSSVDGKSSMVSEGDTSLFSESNELGKDAFLNLLVTQLRYQDPLNPTADTEFVSQLAQFTSLENSQTLVSSMTGLADNMNNFMTLQTLNSQSQVNSQSIGLLGKTVRVSAPEISYAGKPVEVDVYTDEIRDSVLVVIKNSEGEVVRTDKLEMNGLHAAKYTWEGSTNEQKPANMGSYTVEITDDYQNKVVGNPVVEGKVEAIKYTESGANVHIDGKNYLPRYILNIVEG